MSERIIRLEREQALMRERWQVAKLSRRKKRRIRKAIRKPTALDSARRAVKRRLAQGYPMAVAVTDASQKFGVDKARLRSLF